MTEQDIIYNTQGDNLQFNPSEEPKYTKFDVINFAKRYIADCNNSYMDIDTSFENWNKERDLS